MGIILQTMVEISSENLMYQIYQYSFIAEPLTFYWCLPSFREIADKDHKEWQLPWNQSENHTKGIYKMREERFADVNAGESIIFLQLLKTSVLS